MITVDDKQLRKYESDLKEFNERALPFATRFTVHKGAVRGRELGVSNARNQMIMRNKHTEKSIQYYPSRANQMTLSIPRQEAFVGSTEAYMADQEFGANKTSTNSEGHAIPTSWAAMQDGTNPRTKLPRGQRKMRNIKLLHRSRQGKTRQQKNLIAAVMAVKTGRRYTFMDFGKTKGIFRIIGGSRAQKRGWPRGARVKMAYDLSRRSVSIPKNAWLFPAAMEARTEMPKFYSDALLFQLRRNKILGY